MKKVLIIAYEFPPAVASGMYHPFYLAKYLRAFDWEPFILAGTPGDLPQTMEDALDLREALDERHVARAGLASETELAEFVAREIHEPLVRERILRHHQADNSPLSYVFPDPLIRWLPGAWRRAEALMADERFDAVITTSFPFSSVLLGRHLQARFGIPWVAEFRDLWTEDPRFSRCSGALAEDSTWLETKVLESADAVVAVSPPLADRFSRRPGADRKRIQCIELSYEEADFDLVREPPADRFHLVHVGTLYPGMLPPALFKAVDLLVRLGKLDRARFEFTVAGSNLSGQPDPLGPLGFRATGHVPHKDVLALYRQASALLLTLPVDLKEFIPSRLFEYMASGAPILALVPPDSVAAGLIRRSRTGIVVDVESGVDVIANALHDLFACWQAGKLQSDPDWETIRQFSSHSMAGRWARLLETL
jgi:glycosyltransferase involved in cell wall biosynthesis